MSRAAAACSRHEVVRAPVMIDAAGVVYGLAESYATRVPLGVNLEDIRDHSGASGPPSSLSRREIMSSTQ